MRFHKIYYLIVIVLISCGNTLTGYHYSTKAIYKAPNSKLTAHVFAQGIVRAGSDTGEGVLEGYLTRSLLQDTLYFSVNNQIEFIYQKQVKTYNKEHDFSSQLLKETDNIALINYDREEVKELAEVILSAKYGPKATYLKGQTKKVKVISVDFERD